MTRELIRIATRKSPLALWQAYHVRDVLCATYPRLRVDIVEMSTKGDKILDTPLAKIGGKGLFVKELEAGMLENRADIAVHSMKDVPVEFPDGLHLAVIMKREEPFDAFVSPKYARLDDLPEGAIVGTASLRRQCQLLAKRPDLQIKVLRGNVNTRLRKLDEGEFDAIVLAAAGLKRLELGARIRYEFAPEDMLPAIGQGALGIECRSDDRELNTLLEVLNDPDTLARVSAERALNARLEGGCQVPIAGYAEITERETLRLRGLVGSEDGQRIISGEIEGSLEEAAALGELLGADLLAQGAGDLLAALHAAQTD